MNREYCEQFGKWAEQVSAIFNKIVVVSSSSDWRKRALIYADKIMKATWEQNNPYFDNNSKFNI